MQLSWLIIYVQVSFSVMHPLHPGSCNELLTHGPVKKSKELIDSPSQAFPLVCCHCTIWGEELVVGVPGKVTLHWQAGMGTCLGFQLMTTWASA